MKDFQTWMMVGVLKCGSSHHNMTGNYNYFIAENRNTLGRYQDILKARFVRLHGYMTGQQDYDKFVTALANRHSRDSDVSTSSFCAAVDQATQTATAIAADAGKSDELEALAAFRRERP